MRCKVLPSQLFPSNCRVNTKYIVPLHILIYCISNISSSDNEPLSVHLSLSYLSPPVDTWIGFSCFPLHSFDICGHRDLNYLENNRVSFRQSKTTKHVLNIIGTIWHCRYTIGLFPMTRFVIQVMLSVLSEPGNGCQLSNRVLIPVTINDITPSYVPMWYCLIVAC